MKVLIYTHAFAPKVGGLETVVMLLAKGLSSTTEKERTPVDVTVITPTLEDGFDDSKLPFRVIRRLSLWKLVRLIRETDVVHLAGPCFMPLLLGLLLRKPTIVEHHGFQTICPNGQLLYEPNQMPCPGHFMAHRYHECVRCNAKWGKLQSFRMWLLTFLRRWLCQQVSVNVTPTKWLDTVLRLPRTTTIYHGIASNIDKIASYPLSKPLIFAFMGRLVSTKGVHILLHAAHRLKSKGLPFHLKIIGGGPEHKSFEVQAGTLGISDHVTFTGYLSPSALEQAFVDISVVVMPSLAGEVFGLVALENMLQGRLMIVPATGALDEVVGEGGLKFPLGDADKLAECMEEVVACPSVIVERGRMAHERAKQFFSLEKMIAEHLHIYVNVR